MTTSDPRPHIPGYQIERELGQGGMAVVYLARQESLQRHVALKVMKPTSVGVDEEFTQRFLREGQTVARMTHPNIVKVFDTGKSGPWYYLSMEYLDGGTLKERLVRGLDTDQALAIATALGSALTTAHAHQIVHRDLKPANILFYPDGTPVLTDFGIAKGLGEGTALTSTGMCLGSPRYMSPEQILGERIDARSDLYALGALLYELLSGEPPFIATGMVALAQQHLNDPPPPLSRDLDDVQPLVQRLLAKSADERPTTAEEVTQELQQITAGRFTQSGTYRAALTTHQQPSLDTTQATPSSRRNLLPITALCALLLTGMGIALVVWLTPVADKSSQISAPVPSEQPVVPAPAPSGQPVTPAISAAPSVPPPRMQCLRELQQAVLIGEQLIFDLERLHRARRGIASLEALEDKSAVIQRKLAELHQARQQRASAISDRITRYGQQLRTLQTCDAAAITRARALFERDNLAQDRASEFARTAYDLIARRHLPALDNTTDQHSLWHEDYRQALGYHAP